MKKNRIRIAMLLLNLLASMSFAQTQANLAQMDCRLFFPQTNSNEMTRALDSGVLYTEAWEQGAWGPPEEFLGYVFLNPVQYNGKTINVSAGVTNTGAITKIIVAGVDGVDKRFLAQFHGKTSKDSFDLVRTPEDSLTIPVKIKAMQGKQALSELITQSAKEIAIAADKVIN